jgi:lipopolysaccharide/colanic/teichoic acid biosynthesis glycosyltransferase
MEVRRLARLLLHLGIVGTVVGLSKLHAARIGGYDYTDTSRFGWSIAYMALLALAAYGLGLPDVPRTRGGAWLTALASTLVAALAMSVVQLVAGGAVLPRFVVFGAACILPPWYVICCKLAAHGRRHQRRLDQVVFVGGPAEAAALGAELELAPERPASLVGSLEVADAGPGSGRALVELAAAEGATVVVLDRDAQVDESIVAQAAALHVQGVRIRTLSLFYEEWLAKLPLSELERVSLMFDIGEVHRSRYLRVRRLFDVAVAVPGVLLLALLLPVVLVANVVGNRGPVFYRQARVGKGGQLFEILKLRTMWAAADGDQPSEWTSEDDPRITPVGRLLRRTHVDELPQVVNILRGDLAVVGPRPEQPRYVEELSEKLPFYDLRHLVRPGLTGWAQVKYGYAGDETDALQKLQYEFFYLRHQRLSFDVRIVGRTLRSVLGLDGR